MNTSCSDGQVLTPSRFQPGFTNWWVLTISKFWTITSYPLKMQHQPPDFMCKVMSVKTISPLSIHSLMAKPWISRRISFKPFQWWENLHHITSKNKTFSSQILCRVMFLFFFSLFFLRRFAATSSKACDSLFVPCGPWGWETVSSAGLPQRSAAGIGYGGCGFETETIGTETMVSLAFQSSWNRWAAWLWLGFILNTCHWIWSANLIVEADKRDDLLKKSCKVSVPIQGSPRWWPRGDDSTAGCEAETPWCSFRDVHDVQAKSRKS